MAADKRRLYFSLLVKNSNSTVALTSVCENRTLTPALTGGAVVPAGIKWVFILTLISLSLFAQKKQLPGQAGNDDVELVGSVIVDREEIKQAVGMDVGAGYVAIRMKVTPKTDKPLAISADDFTIVSRKDGQRSQALSPGQIAGKDALVVKPAATQPGGFGTMTNGPIWGGDPRDAAGLLRAAGRGTPAERRAGSKPRRKTAPTAKTRTKKKSTTRCSMRSRRRVCPTRKAPTRWMGCSIFRSTEKSKPKDLRR